MVADCQHRQLSSFGSIYSTVYRCDHCGRAMQTGDKHEVTAWRDTKLECGIGHVVSGRQRTVQIVRSTEGSQWLSETQSDYDPGRCVVCGLFINKAVDNNNAKA